MRRKRRLSFAPPRAPPCNYSDLSLSFLSVLAAEQAPVIEKLGPSALVL